MQRWTNDDFNALSWHDNHVHGLCIRVGAHKRTELVLDIDFALEWLPPVDGYFHVRVAPATLTFHEVSDLNISLSNPGGANPICPFSIDGLEREDKVHSNGYRTFAWFIGLNCPGGELSFEASGFTQVLRAAPRESDRIYIPAEERPPESGA